MLILTHDDFSPHLNTTFTVATPGLEPQEWELVDVKVYSIDSIPAYLKPKRVPFVLVFRGPADPLVPEQIHTLRHAAMGEHEIYTIPLGPLGQSDALFYQAAFN
ncbi:MAG: hypothetical protein U0794_14130 [Isosphaeraceae bacterium]